MSAISRSETAFHALPPRRKTPSAPTGLWVRFALSVQTPEAAALPKVKFEVVVSRLANWPSCPRPPRAPLPPPPLLTTREAFSAFYAKAFAGRRLEWLPHAGRCEVTAKIRALSQVRSSLLGPALESGFSHALADACVDRRNVSACMQSPAEGPFPEYTLRVSEIQTIVLLLFNSREEVSLQQAVEATGFCKAKRTWTPTPSED